MSTLTTPDLQSMPPRVAVSLGAVGVRGVRRAVGIDDVGSAAMVLDADVDLAADRGGAHMSRFHETVEDVLEDVLANGRVASLIDLARNTAMQLIERQGTRTATVRIEAATTCADHAPVTGTPTAEPVVLITHARAMREAAAERIAVRSAFGVRAQGFNACPCAQALVADAAGERLADAGYSTEQVREVLDLVPVATHNQRAEGTLVIGTERPLDWRMLLAVVHGSMSSRTYELLKRPDEQYVVEQAHRRPMFVEDSARAMLAAAVELPLDADDLVSVHQRNLESIHTHDVVAAHSSRHADLRAELAGQAPVDRLTLDAWLHQF